MNNIPDFYPTPAKLIDKMLEGIKLEEISTVLEPSAGKGDIVDRLIEKSKLNSTMWRRDQHFDIDTIEINQNLRHVLKGKNYRVVHDDFLTYQTYKRYDLILMNPPFSNGDLHLLKALKIQESGGKVVCLLNAETIKNPYTNIRMDLVQQLEEYNAEIQYLTGAFSEAERRTDVEVALIKVNVPATAKQSLILNDLKQEEVYRTGLDTKEEIVEKDPLKKIVAQYNYEVQAGLKLITEYQAMRPYILKSLKGNADSPILSLTIDATEKNHCNIWNTYIEKVRYKYWEVLFQTEAFSNIFTSKLRSEYYERIKDLQHYDFSLYNIYSLQAEIAKTMSTSIEKTIIALFDDLSRKYHWYDETSKNIHFYNGWKTNQSWYINKRVIIPLNAYSWGELHIRYNAEERLRDIERALDYLDGGNTTDFEDLAAALQRAEREKQTSKIQLKYFTVTFYKKGTCHIEFTNLDLLKKLNLFGSQRKGWLPPSYGKANYDDMTPEEKTVIDDFEGAAEYRKVMANREYFIQESVGLIMLEGPKEKVAS